MARTRLIVAFLGLVAVAVMLAVHQRRRKRCLADDEDREDDFKDTLKKVKSDCRNASSFDRVTKAYGIKPNTPEWHQAWAKCQEGMAKMKEAQASREGKTLSCTPCPSEYLKVNKPCFKKDDKGKGLCCNSKMEKCKPMDMAIGRDYDCKVAKNRQCTPDGGKGDYKKYCYKGTSSYNQGKCCKQPWSTDCKPILVKGSKPSEPAPANSSDNTAPADTSPPKTTMPPPPVDSPQYSDWLLVAEAQALAAPFQ